MSTSDGRAPPSTPTPDAQVEGHVSDVTGGQVAIGGRVFQIDAAQGSFVVINAESDVQVERRPVPVLRPPPAFPALVGRVPELRRIRAVLNSGMSVEVSGPGGIGKTALLRAASNAPLPDSTPDGVVAIPARLGTEDTLSYVFDTCYVGTRRVVPRREELISALSDLRLLLVVDDTSLTRDDIDELREGLPTCLFLLAGIEQRVFDGVEGVSLAGLTVVEGVELIQAGIGRELTQRERDVGARVSEVLRGTPLELVRFASLVRADDGDVVSVARGFGVDAQPEDLLVAVMRNVSHEEESVLAALSAFDAPVGAGPVAALSGHTDAGGRLYKLCERGLVQGDDLQGWRARDRTAASPEERQRAAVVLTAWVRHRSVPEEVAGEIPAIASVLHQARQDHRWEDAIALAAAAERPLALAGRWSAWRDTLEAGRHAARLSGDDASARFFSHQLGVIDDAMTGVIPVVDGSTGPHEAGGAVSDTVDVAESVEGPWDQAPIEVHTGPRWGRVMGAVAALLAVLALMFGGVMFLASGDQAPEGSTPPTPTGTTGPQPPTDGPTTGGPPVPGAANLTAFTLKSETPQLAVGETKPFTVRVWNKPLDTRDVGPSQGGSLTISASGDAAGLRDDTAGCSPDGDGLRCPLPTLERGDTKDFTIRLEGRTPGTVTLTMTVSTAGDEGAPREATFTVTDASGVGTCTVPDVLGSLLDQAKARLQADQFQVALISEESRETSGVVLRQVPTGGTEAPCGSTVTLYHSPAD